VQGAKGDRECPAWIGSDEQCRVREWCRGWLTRDDDGPCLEGGSDGRWVGSIGSSEGEVSLARRIEGAHPHDADIRAEHGCSHQGGNGTRGEFSTGSAHRRRVAFATVLKGATGRGERLMVVGVSRAEVAAAVAGALEVDPGSVEGLHRSEDGPWDSVGHIQVILVTEELIGIPLLEDDLAGITCLEDLMAAIQRAGSATE